MYQNKIMSTNLSWGEHVVEILKEVLIFDLIISEEEGYTFTLMSGCPVQELQILHQITHIVWSVEEG